MYNSGRISSEKGIPNEWGSVSLRRLAQFVGRNSSCPADSELHPAGTAQSNEIDAEEETPDDVRFRVMVGNHWALFCRTWASFDTEKFLMSFVDLFRRRKALCAILAISAVTRIALALKGGQFFAPDELRYLRCFVFIHKLALFDLRGVTDQVLGTPDHVGFIFTGVPAAIVHIAFLGIRGLPETQSSVVATAWVSGLCFTVPSVISIALVYAISRRAGAELAEALMAAFLIACSTAMFWYCRHFLPYDISMALALFALWLGIAEKPTLRASLSCGLVVGIAGLTYNGYWVLCAVVLAFHVLYRVPDLAAAVKRTVVAALGAISLPAVLIAIPILLGR